MLNKVTEFSFILVFALLLWLSCYTVNAYAGDEFTGCDQHAYDRVYQSITQDALSRSLRAVTDEEQDRIIRDRLDAIEGLRMLCRGQRSTYELPYQGVTTDEIESEVVLR